MAGPERTMRLGAFGLFAALSVSLWFAAGLPPARSSRSGRRLNVLLGALLMLSVVPIWI